MPLACATHLCQHPIAVLYRFRCPRAGTMARTRAFLLLIRALHRITRAKLMKVGAVAALMPLGLLLAHVVPPLATTFDSCAKEGMNARYRDFCLCDPDAIR